MSLLVLFFIIFIGGPLAFRALMQGGPSPVAFRRLAIFMAVCASTGLTLRYGFAHLWGRNLLVTGGGIVFIWGGWIGVLAYGAQSLRRMDHSGRMRRLSAVCGALGTTVPWFGLASASLLAG
ncbi:hypothetical protein [Sulfitobacter guttiformis]|uniref:Uncharacterized protein n=1 Tax=Sulfitobacter guttiformis TaxID=74349 RepID=A0A420DRC5_9RHOB|nr:hypothetical protein [Sulfitobacter guttiformis]KIN74192.1 hypothetical protein Z949_3388 [Sulfitobacter guttiformis KCTC 32187]RKE96805.1 hypothetical protein C8N30_1375 [Sulfitobacter guttiformis]